MISESHAYDPQVDSLPRDGVEGRPSLEAQMEFFNQAFMQGGEVTKRPRLVTGPFYSDFAEVMRQTEADVKSINPHFTPEHIMPSTYQSPYVRYEVDISSTDTRIALMEVSARRMRRTDMLARGVIGDTVGSQILLPGELNVPEYAKQDEEWEHSQASRACSNACFRMVFGSVAGWVPSETAVGEQLLKHHGTAIVDDKVFNDVYQTEAFKEISDKSVISLELIGADLELISRLTRKVKERQPDAQVFCTVNLASASSHRSIWHAAALLSATESRVTCHDPSVYCGGAFHTQDKTEFLRRWAVAYNRAQLIIAA